MCTQLQIQFEMTLTVQINSLPLCLCFSVMASRLLDQTGDILEVRMDECCEVLHTINERKDVR